MTDTRELILCEILSILNSMTGISHVFRNEPSNIPEEERPAAILIDGGEDANQNDRNQDGMSPRVVRMIPQIALLISDQSDTVGTKLNGLRKTAIYDLASNVALRDLTKNECGIVYLGSETVLGGSRKVDGAMLLNFGIDYVLKPGDLAP